MREDTTRLRPLQRGLSTVLFVSSNASLAFKTPPPDFNGSSTTSTSDSAGNPKATGPSPELSGRSQDPRTPMRTSQRRLAPDADADPRPALAGPRHGLIARMRDASVCRCQMRDRTYCVQDQTTMKMAVLAMYSPGKAHQQQRMLGSKDNRFV